MIGNLKKNLEKRKKRAMRVRKWLRGSSEKPRLSVHKSNKNIYAQIIDDEAGKTLVGIGTRSKQINTHKSKESAKTLGTKIAELAKEKQIQKVVFDRGKFKYHGIVAELANAAREAGLKF